MQPDRALTRIRRAAACMLLAAALPAAGQPQRAYVDDRIEVGLHEDKTLASTILTLLPSGTPLEVLERDGGFARVQTAEGKKGWVDARFLSDDVPARTRAQTLEIELAGAQADLADAQARIVALEQQLAGDPEAAAAAAAPEAIPSETLREMQALAEENQTLKQQVAELEAVQRMDEEQQSGTPSPAPVTVTVAPPREGLAVGPLALVGLDPWKLLLLGSALLLAFAAGAWLVDWDVRRRHGGFRI